MKIQRRFTKAGKDVFSSIEWTQRSSRILNPDGSVVFEMHDVDVPKSWSQLATDIMVSKYFRKAGVPQQDAEGKVLKDEHGNPITGPEKSARQVIHRLAGCWRHWGEKHSYFNTAADAQAFYDEMCWMLVTQAAAPNSPQWFNTGLNWAYGINGPAQGHWFTDPTTGETKLAADAYTHPQPHACFIQSIEDDLVNEGGIMDLWVREARLFKYGSGTGTNFSRLRGDGEKLSGGGRSSGLMSFLKIGDRAAGAIKSGGTTRRAAKMVCLDLDHPDIENFVNWKVREELKVAAMVEGVKHLPKSLKATIEKLGMKIDYDFNGEAYATVSGQNSNNSVRIPNAFFHRLDEDGYWELLSRTSGDVAKSIRARELWEQINYAAWRCADPGVQFDTTVNEWHTCPASGRINASNPCVTGDTLVSTTTGYRRIKDLVGATAEVIAGDGKPAFVDSIFKTGTKPVFELKTRSGYRLKLTADHRVRTENRGDVAASELRHGDRVLLRGAGFGDQWLDENVAEQLGHELATGCHLSTSSNASKSEQEVFQARYEFTDGEHESLCFKDSFFSLCRTSQMNVVKGIFQSDVEPAQVSQVLAHQLQLILLSFGAKASVHQGASVFEICDGHRKDATLYSVRLQGATVQQLAGAALVAAGSHGSLEEERRIVDEFASLTSAGIEDVFDLTESRTSHFVANGMVVHNCSEYMFLDNTACNLASINLLKFYDSQTRQFDLDGYEHAIKLWTVVLEISVLMAAFPSKEIARLSYEYRTLGLGYANLGAMLMQAGIAYDSDLGRDIGAALAAIMTGRSYAASAQMAAEHGPFPGFYKNREHMLRVVRNHRRAAYGVPRTREQVSQMDENDFQGLGWYEGLEIPPVPIDGTLLDGEHATEGPFGQLANSSDVLRRARRAWDDALKEGDAHGYRNAQTTVIAPTGTIGLLMDCDTTGVEPDFALVKFKKLAGGGHFKIANQSLKPALVALGYSEKQVAEMMTYAMGASSLDVPLPDDNGRVPKNPSDTFADYLRAKGATREDLKKLTDALGGAMELSFVFNAITLGAEALERMNLQGQGDLLAGLGLTAKQIDKLNEMICGMGTIEGAPHIKEQHLPVFDCANRCGKIGKRFIAPQGHIRMMAAVQPFISGAISKTINLPREATVSDIGASYRLSWELGLKANALYRDGSKLSQVLQATSSEALIDAEEDDEEGIEAAKKEVTAEVSDLANRVATAGTEPLPGGRGQLIDPAGVQVEKIVERIVERPLRRRLPNTRRSITHKFNVAGHEGYLTVGLYEDGMPGELFLTMAKEGSTIGGLMDSLGTAISVALQYGVPVESLVTKFTHQRFEPAGMTDNSDIPFAKSLVDYIFRWMGMEFIAGYREANAPKRSKPVDQHAPATAPAAGSSVASVQATSAASSASATANAAASKSSERTDSKLDEWSGASQGGAAPADFKNKGGNGGGKGRLAIDDPQIVINHAVRTGPIALIQSRTGMALAAMDRQQAAAGAMVSTLNEANSQMMGDAPACDVCGSITVRNGTCYKCLNCGNSMGCS
ncbi:MAG: TSCPD domain-containing protein [Phycisphaerales bacterium]